MKRSTDQTKWSHLTAEANLPNNFVFLPLPDIGNLTVKVHLFESYLSTENSYSTDPQKYRQNVRCVYICIWLVFAAARQRCLTGSMCTCIYMLISSFVYPPVACLVRPSDDYTKASQCQNFRKWKDNHECLLNIVWYYLYNGWYMRH